MNTLTLNYLIPFVDLITHSKLSQQYKHTHNHTSVLYKSIYIYSCLQTYPNRWRTARHTMRQRTRCRFSAFPATTAEFRSTSMPRSTMNWRARYSTMPRTSIPSSQWSVCPATRHSTYASRRSMRRDRAKWRIACADAPSRRPFYAPVGLTLPPPTPLSKLPQNGVESFYPFLISDFALFASLSLSLFPLSPCSLLDSGAGTIDTVAGRFGWRHSDALFGGHLRGDFY